LVPRVSGGQGPSPALLRRGLVAYRDESGQLHVLEAHCKHLGAHIGHGGTVIGDGLGGAISVFEGAQNHRLIFTCTPVDDECSDLFYWIWWPRTAGDIADVPDGRTRDVIEKQFLSTVFDDLEIWRYHKYVERPALSRQDAKGYMALRKWAAKFYDVAPKLNPPDVGASA
jgi:hypothetical protein